MSYPHPQSLHIVCLCAAWCGTCTSYRATFEALQRAHPQHTFAWLDIEQAPFAESGLEVENFPTIWLGTDSQALFYGTVLPHAAVVEKMLEKALQGSLRIADKAIEAEAELVREMLGMQ